MYFVFKRVQNYYKNLVWGLFRMKNPLLRDDFSLFHPLRMGLDRKALFFMLIRGIHSLLILLSFFYL